MQVEAELKKYAAVTRSLDGAERARIFCLAAEVESYMSEELESLLEAHPSAPCLIQFSCDCTPVRVRQYYSHASVAGNRRSSTA
eukprot:6487011-Amphidinium_carterae.1